MTKRKKDIKVERRHVKKKNLSGRERMEAGDGGEVIICMHKTIK